MVLTNEEGIDWVNRSGKAWPATIGAPEARQIGAVVAIDEKNGQGQADLGHGPPQPREQRRRPGLRPPVVLSGDDSFVSNPAQAQLYSYIADSSDEVWNDEGDLWAFVAERRRRLLRLRRSARRMSVTGKFVQVPKDIATGQAPDGTELMAADKGYPLPPNDGTWQRDARTGLGIDGPQWVLEHWGDTQPQPVFQFVRVEDIAYDRRPGHAERRLRRRQRPRRDERRRQPVHSSNGRVWKLVLDKSDPTKVTSFSVLIEGDDAPVKAPARSTSRTTSSRPRRAC